jgi:pyruvate/2-oxoglutarate/acetoin dehydrogenase E1 component
MDTPLSEAGFVGRIGCNAGMRPIVEVMTVNFSLLAFDQIVNNAATLLHMSGGQVHAGGHTHWMRNRTAIGGTTFAQLGTFTPMFPD